MRLVNIFNFLASPGNPKLGLRMTTLHEEQIPMTNRKHSLDFDRISDIIEEDKYDDSNDEENDRKNGFPDYEIPAQVTYFYLKKIRSIS